MTIPGPYCSPRARRTSVITPTLQTWREAHSLPSTSPPHTTCSSIATLHVTFRRHTHTPLQHHLWASLTLEAPSVLGLRLCICAPPASLVPPSLSSTVTYMVISECPLSLGTLPETCSSQMPCHPCILLTGAASPSLPPCHFRPPGAQGSSLLLTVPSRALSFFIPLSPVLN